MQRRYHNAAAPGKPDERTARAIAFLERALAWFARHGVSVGRIMTDNGNAHRTHDFCKGCISASVRDLRTRPYTPRTNGKAELFLHTVMRECAYAHAFRSSQQRADALPRWPHLYNVHRPHTALAGQPRISWLGMSQPASSRQLVQRSGRSIQRRTAQDERCAGAEWIFRPVPVLTVQ